ncbi:MAG: hypothetical protein ABJQ33_12055, partial [Alloalcanivorax venustensis]
ILVMSLAARPQRTMFGSRPVNKSLQFVPALTGLHRTAFSPLRCAKAAAEYWRYVFKQMDFL